MITPRIREPTGEDVPLILNSWLESYREVGENRAMANDVYFSIHKPRIVGLLERAHVKVACNAEDTWQILGWVAYQGLVLHYVFVKHAFRHLGIANRLFGAANPHRSPMIATHTGWMWPSLKRSWKLTFDPRWAGLIATDCTSPGSTG